MQITESIDMDLSKELLTKIDTKQNDTKSRFIQFNLLYNFLPLDLTNNSIKIYAVKPDETLIFNNITVVDASSGKILVELTNQALALEGILQCELVIYGNDGSIFSSKEFGINVLPSLRNDVAIESSNEFNALTDALTQAQKWNDEFEEEMPNLDQRYQDRLNEIYSELADIAYVKKHKPQYRGIAISILNDTDFSTMMPKLVNWGGQIEVVVFVSVTDINSNSFTTINASKMNEFFNLVSQNNLKVTFMKIHLVKNFNDGTDGMKSVICPMSGSENTWFTNYEQAIRFYLAYAQNNNISRVSLANENYILSTTASYITYWSTLITNIKSGYPNIKLTYSTSNDEQQYFISTQNAGIDNLLKYVDFLACNEYPSVSNYSIYTEGQESLNDMITNPSVVLCKQVLQTLNSLYKKEIFISEIGCMNRVNSLYMPIDSNYNSQTYSNVVQGIYYNVIFNSLALIDFVTGLFIWHYDQPFSPDGTSAVQVYQNYMNGDD